MMLKTFGIAAAVVAASVGFTSRANAQLMAPPYGGGYSSPGLTSGSYYAPGGSGAYYGGSNLNLSVGNSYYAPGGLGVYSGGSNLNLSVVNPYSTGYYGGGAYNGYYGGSPYIGGYSTVLGGYNSYYGSPYNGGYYANTRVGRRGSRR
jgi:hypothetical protein